MSVFGDPDLLARVHSSAERDQRERPMAISKDDVPWSIESITTGWLDACIGAGAGRSRIVRADVFPASAGTSVRGAIAVYRENGAAERLFAKTYPEVSHRMANILTRTAQAEGAFYEDLRPQLQAEIPQGCYWAVDEERFRAIVIVEDVGATQGAAFCTWKTEISRREAEDAIDLLAAFHARFRGPARLKSAHPWLTTFAEWTQAFEYLKEQHLQAMQAARDVIPPRLRERGKELFERLMALRVRPVDGSFTLIHSDVHLGNWYRTGTGRMGLCDWQCCTIGPGVRDVAYAISTLLAPAVRKSSEAGLLDRYAAAMAAAGAPVDRATLELDYRRYLLAALMMWTPTLCPAEGFPDMQPRDMSMLMIQRIATAIEENDSLAAFE